jgi:hypothetical protein
MENSHYSLSAEQLSDFQDRGYLLIRQFFTSGELQLLQQWAQEVHDLPCTPDTPWMPYEEVNSKGKRVLCRTENFATPMQDSTVSYGVSVLQVSCNNSPGKKCSSSKRKSITSWPEVVSAFTIPHLASIADIICRWI